MKNKAAFQYCHDDEIVIDNSREAVEAAIQQTKDKADTTWEQNARTGERFTPWARQRRLGQTGRKSKAKTRR